MGGVTLPDGELVRRSLSGDADAFASLYRSHVGAVHRVIAEAVHDRETVADLVQEVFARAIEALATLRERDRFRPWVLSIARHAAIDHARLHRDVAVLDVDGQPETESADPEPGAVAEINMLVQRVRGCVAGLSTRDATVLALVTQLGYAPAEVGRALGISPGTAKVVLHRARRRLRRALALALLAEHQADACPEFRNAFDRGRLAEAGNHIGTCPRCRAAVNGDVELYGQAGGSRPTTLMPARDSTSASPSGNAPAATTPNPATSPAS